MSVAAACRRLADAYFINDINEPLAGLWGAILNRPQHLSDAYELHWRAQSKDPRKYFEEVRAQFNQGGDPADLLYLLARCVKAAVRYNSRGEFNNSPDHRRLGMRPTKMRENILSVAGLLSESASVSSVDYREAIADAGPRDLVYMDPPYQGVSATRDCRYLQGLSWDEFAESLEALVAKGVPFIVSYDGRTGDKEYGKPLPDSLGLFREEVYAGTSAQATLGGQVAGTYESLYLSPSVVNRLSGSIAQQLTLYPGTD